MHTRKIALVRSLPVVVVVGKAHGHHIGKGAALSCLLILATLKDTHSFSKAGMVSFYVQISVLVSCLLHKGLKIWYGEWLALHRIPAGILHAWNHY